MFGRGREEVNLPDPGASALLEDPIHERATDPGAAPLQGDGD